MSSPSGTSTRVFVSYSHRDKKWLERLQIHLKPLVRAGNIDLWDDTRIQRRRNRTRSCAILRSPSKLACPVRLGQVSWWEWQRNRRRLRNRPCRRKRLMARQRDLAGHPSEMEPSGQQSAGT